jgi:hypothetical protein
MPYSFAKARIYRMPTHFGPAPGRRAIRPELSGDQTELSGDQSNSPRKTLVSASFFTDPAALDCHIPRRFSLLGVPLVTVELHFLTDVAWLAGRGYTMIHVWWPATFEGSKERVAGRFLAVMWENLADPIITGRGEIGQPKLFADIPDLKSASGTFECSASWFGFEFLKLEAVEGEAVPPDQRPDLDGTLMLKYVPPHGRMG